MTSLSAAFGSTLGPFLFALALSLILVPAARAAATRLGCVAVPREDRWHRRPIALFGGVAIGLTLFTGLFAFRTFDRIEVLVVCGALIFVAGLADDIFSLEPFTKLVVQIAIASVLLFFGYRLQWTTSLTLDTMLTLIWVVGMTNAFNLLDNMDGLCAGIALIVGGALLIGLPQAAAGSEAFYQARYLALLLGATAGFLVFNRHPATIFMGDSGSLLLGLSFAALTLGHGEDPVRSNPLSIVAAPVLVLLIPIFDTALVTASRLLSGRAPSEGGLDHSSHRLVAVGLSEPAAVALLWLLAAIGGTLGLAVDYFNLSWSGPAVALFLLGMAVFAAYLLRIRTYEEEQVDDSSKLTPLVVDFMYKRQVFEVIVDLCLVAISYYVAYRLRFDETRFGPNFPFYYLSLPLVLAGQMLALFFVGMYRTVWRNFGFADIRMIAKGVLIGTFSAELLILHLYRFESYSRAVFVIYAVLLGVMLTAAHAGFSAMGELLDRNRQQAPGTDLRPQLHVIDGQSSSAAPRWFRKIGGSSGKTPDLS